MAARMASTTPIIVPTRILLIIIIILAEVAVMVTAKRTGNMLHMNRLAVSFVALGQMGLSHLPYTRMEICLSTPHRVRNLAPHNRLSVPFFFDPNFNAEVKPIEISERVNDNKEERWIGPAFTSFAAPMAIIC
jgi:hypothetical protein